jgi:hypothetical protein
LRSALASALAATFSYRAASTALAVRFPELPFAVELLGARQVLLRHVPGGPGCA